MSSKELTRADLSQDVVDRFWSKVNKNEESGCWEWTGGTVGGGYGRFRGGVGHGRDGFSKRIYVHRYAYELLVGPIPAGYEVDHQCRNTICCNPAHLEPVPHDVNSQRQGLRSDNTSGVRGVSWHKASQKWRVVVGQHINGKQKKHWGGLYTDQEFEAACAKVIAMRLEIFGPDDEREARIEVDQALASRAAGAR